MKSNISSFDIRDENNESPNTIHKIKHFCHNCRWSFNTCPNTDCVQNLRSSTKKNAPDFDFISEVKEN